MFHYSVRNYFAVLESQITLFLLLWFRVKMSQNSCDWKWAFGSIELWGHQHLVLCLWVHSWMGFLEVGLSWVKKVTECAGLFFSSSLILLASWLPWGKHFSSALDTPNQEHKTRSQKQTSLSSVCQMFCPNNRNVANIPRGFGPL